MFETNLIPNVKLEMLKLQKIRNLVIFYSVIVVAAVVGVIVVLFLVLGGQVVYSNATTNTINREFAELRDQPGLNTMLTLQSQMSNIGALSDERMILSRLFAFLDVSVPGEDTPYFITISSINYNQTTGMIILEGQTQRGFQALDAFMKTIDLTGYRFIPDFDENLDSDLSDEELEERLSPAIDEDPIPLLAESININNTSFGRSDDGGLALRFNIAFILNPDFFSFNRKHVVVEGPTRQIVTDSYIQIRDDIFADPARDCEPEDIECLTRGRF